jgi:hypothetical protein
MKKNTAIEIINNLSFEEKITLLKLLALANCTEDKIKILEEKLGITISD